MNQYQNSLFPQTYAPKKSSSGAKAVIVTMFFFALFGFVAGLAILLFRNAYLFS